MLEGVGVGSPKHDRLLLIPNEITNLRKYIVMCPSIHKAGGGGWLGLVRTPLWGERVGGGVLVSWQQQQWKVILCLAEGVFFLFISFIF